MTGAAEVELKLRMPAAAAAAVAAHPALRAVASGPPRRAQLSATYFDTPDLALAAQGIALRVRREHGRWLQTIKTAGTLAGGLAQRPEYTWPLGRGPQRPDPDLARLDGTPLAGDLARAFGGRAPAPCFVTSFRRTTIPLAFADGTRALAALDVGHVAPAGREEAAVPFAELELELVDGDVRRLFDVALALAADLPLDVETRSKAERGYALVARTAPQPVRAPAVAYAADAPADAAFAAILHGVLTQVAGNADGIADGADPEWVHQLRVGLRRLRSALALARPVVPAATLAALADEARAIATALGPARDLDVFAAETLPALARTTQGVDVPVVAAALARLEAALPPARARAYDEARRAVASPRFRTLVLGLGALVAGPRPPHEGAASLPVRDVAREALRRRHRRLREAGTHVLDGTPAQRHGVRIAAKKLRYAAEFFAPAFPGRRAQAYRDALARLQEALGRANDASTAVTVAASLCGPEAAATALVAGWAGARAAAGRELARAWSAFADAKPFWKDRG